jgi:hypothetical protein
MACFPFRGHRGDCDAQHGTVDQPYRKTATVAACAHILDLPIDAAEARSILGISEAGYCAATAFGFLPKSFSVGDRTVREMQMHKLADLVEYEFHARLATGSFTPESLRVARTLVDRLLVVFDSDDPFAIVTDVAILTDCIFCTETADADGCGPDCQNWLAHVLVAELLHCWLRCEACALALLPDVNAQHHFLLRGIPDSEAPFMELLRTFSFGCASCKLTSFGATSKKSS